MSKAARHYKEFIRDKVISIRLKEEEFLRLKANALRDRTSLSQMVRGRITTITDETSASGVTEGAADVTTTALG